MPAVPEPHVEREQLRVGLVGYGMAGELFHARLIRACPDLALAGVVTGNPERAARVHRDHPGAVVVPDVDALLGHPALGGPPDVLVVATPDETHVPVAQAGLRAGCDIVVDKPLAPTAAGAAQLVEEARQAGRRLTVFMNRRRDSDQLTLAALIAEGVLGRVHRHESRFERWRPAIDPGKWRDRLPAERGGGQLLNLGPHVVDQAIELFGPIERVCAEVRAVRGGSDDVDFVAAWHASGATSHLSLGSVFAAPGPRRRVLGDEGAFVVDGLDGQEEQLRAGVDPHDPSFGVEPESAWGRLQRGAESTPVPARRGDWAGFYPALAASVRDGGPVPVDPADGVAMLRVLEAVRTSAETGEVVRLSHHGQA